MTMPTDDETYTFGGFDYAGRELEIVGTCSRCGAEKTRVREFGDGGSIFHRNGCTGSGGLLPYGDHLNTRMVIEQCKERDAHQVRVQEHAKRNPSPFASDMGKEHVRESVHARAARLRTK